MEVDERVRLLEERILWLEDRERKLEASTRRQVRALRFWCLLALLAAALS